MASIPYPRSRPRLVQCKCRSHCTSWNPLTREYEGNGHPQSRSTRDNHRLDDRRNMYIERPPLPTRQPTTSSPGSGSSSGDASHVCPPRVNIYRKEVEWFARLPITSITAPLVFINDPLEIGAFIQPSFEDMTRPNHGLYALRSRLAANATFLATETRYCEIFHYTSTMEPSSGRDNLLERLREEFVRLSHEKEIQWAQQRVKLTPDHIVVSTNIHFRHRGLLDPTVYSSTIVALVMCYLFFSPRRAVRAQLAGSRDVLRAQGASSSIIQMIPKDPRSLPSLFQLDSITRQYVCCPACYSLYTYDATATVPDNCTFKQTPTSQACDEPLWKQKRVNGGLTKSPREKHIHHDLKFWLGQLLSRQGFEDAIEECQPTQAIPGAPVSDIRFSKAFRELKDSDGNPFFPGVPGGGRLVLSLSVDGFNPFHNKTAKQTVSCTGIWLVLLNLPPHLRHLPENIFPVCVLNGKPSLDQINHVLRLIVQDVLEFWSPGVYFSRTYNHPKGKHFRAMLIPLIADMPSARQVLGLPAVLTAHNFCTACDLDIDDIHIVNRTEWPSKDASHVRRIAMKWKEARSEAEQGSIFKGYGLRWCPLLDLPYWNPVLYAVIESMHVGNLGLIQNHCRNLFRIDVEVRRGGDGRATNLPAPKKQARIRLKDLNKCLGVIVSGDADMLDRLLKFHRRILYKICEDQGIIGEGKSVVAGTRWILARNICNWRHSGHPNVRRILSSLRASQEEESAKNRLPNLDGSGIDPGLALRIVRHLVSKDATSRDKAYLQGTALIFKYICNLLNINIGADESDESRVSKRQLYQRIIETINSEHNAMIILESYTRPTVPSAGFDADEIEDATDEIEVPAADHLDDAMDVDEINTNEVDGPAVPSDYSGRTVLGKDIMKAVWDDMKRTQLPSWIQSAPSNWGTPGRGKLTASQWQVICTVHLPITLIHLWTGQAGRKRELLDNFMDLVASIRIANMRVSSATQVEAYNRHIFRYVSRIQELYPDENLRPIHHASLHLGETMEFFGPVHAISAPFYERFINFYHHMKKNQKLAEIGPTLSRTAMRAANLRILLAKDNFMQDMLATLESTENEDLRGYNLAALADPTSPSFAANSRAIKCELPNEIYALFVDALADPHTEMTILPRSALSVPQVSRDGVLYGTSSTRARRDSNIFYRLHTQLHRPSSDNTNSGVIQNLFKYTYVLGGADVTDIFCVVTQHCAVDASRAIVDPYAQFPYAGFLRENRAGPQRLIRLNDIISHTAITPLTGIYDGLIHVLPVDKLMTSFDEEGLGPLEGI